ncbi:MAG: OmpA family protein [Candidatus Adiutrix sp.]|jgi:chemotaxis protein MotB|nr:OmpA family protein [Candidatus Adiutrix sp.]
MSGDKKTPIIKKIIKKGHGGHHGGSWKVAYADFVTALMAFFLVMWLLAISSEAGREALADYFNELTMSDAVFNGGLPSAFTEGGSKGASILDGGCFRPTVEASTEPADEEEAAASAAVQAQMALLIQNARAMLENLNNLPEGTEGGEGAGDAGHMDAGQEAFKEQLMNEIQGGLGEAAAGQVSVEKVKGGLRIQIVDQEGRPLFRSAGSALTPEAKAILELVAARLRTVPNKISIEGHTDAMTFSGQRVTNWELSTARASAARMYLAQTGVGDDRLLMVAGYAATQPLAGADPSDPTNRRISIMIWDEDEKPLPPPPGPAPGAAGPPAAPAGAAGPAASSPAAAGASDPGAAVRTLPPVPSAPPARPRPQPARPEPAQPLTGEELERLLIEKTMEEATTPDLSTVGPPAAPENQRE